MSSPSEKKRKKQKDRSNRKKLDKLNQKDPFAYSKDEKDFGKIQIYIVAFISVLAAILVIYAFS